MTRIDGIKNKRKYFWEYTIKKGDKSANILVEKSTGTMIIENTMFLPKYSKPEGLKGFFFIQDSEGKKL